MKSRSTGWGAWSVATSAAARPPGAAPPDARRRLRTPRSPACAAAEAGVAAALRALPEPLNASDPFFAFGDGGRYARSHRAEAGFAVYAHRDYAGGDGATKRCNGGGRVGAVGVVPTVQGATDQGATDQGMMMP